MNPGTIRRLFVTVFGDQPNGCNDNPEVLAGRLSAPIAEACRAAMDLKTPVLHEYFEAWDRSGSPGRGEPAQTPRHVEAGLAYHGLPESAWLLARLHVDQVVKQEAATGERVPDKGRSLANVALLGRGLGSPAVERHYAQLASAGDYYRTGTEAGRHGVGAELMEGHESRQRHDEWRGYVAEQLAAIDPKQPLFLDAYLAARWFRGTHQASLTERAKPSPGDPLSFVERLLREVADRNGSDTATRCTLFQAAAGLLLSGTTGFTVFPCRWNQEERMNLVVRYEPDPLAPPVLPRGFGLVECKAEKAAVPSAALRDFGAKCLFHRVQFGILVARAGIRGGGELFADLTGAELTRRRFLGDGLTLLVLDIDQLRGSDQELRGLHDPLFDDYQRLVFGRIVGEE